jgi:hypothetical protein
LVTRHYDLRQKCHAPLLRAPLDHPTGGNSKNIELDLNLNSQIHFDIEKNGELYVFVSLSVMKIAYKISMPFQ